LHRARIVLRFVEEVSVVGLEGRRGTRGSRRSRLARSLVDPMLGRVWTEVGRRLTHVRHRRGKPPPAETLIHKYAPGRTFADIGCMWGIDGGNAFLAEEVGATAVTAFDVMLPTEAFNAEHARRGSKVRYVNGNLSDPAAAEEIGPHQVVWCTGVLYHAPSPIQVLERLHAICTEYLIIGTKTIPEIPGVPQAAVLFPGLTDTQRVQYGRLWGPLGDPFVPETNHANWWWGVTPSGFRAMVKLGFDIVESLEGPLHTARDNLILVGRAR
jgi:hypothetical protein